MTKFPPISRGDIELYETWLATEKRYLPRAGGLLDQPGGVIRRLTDIQVMCQMVEKIAEIEEKQFEQYEKMRQASKGIGD